MRALHMAENAKILTLHLYLKSRKTPIEIELTETQLSDLYKMIQTNDVIAFKTLVFRREELLYGFAD